MMRWKKWRGTRNSPRSPICQCTAVTGIISSKPLSFRTIRARCARVLVSVGVSLPCCLLLVSSPLVSCVIFFSILLSPVPYHGLRCFSSLSPFSSILLFARVHFFFSYLPPLPFLLQLRSVQFLPCPLLPTIFSCMLLFQQSR